MVVIARSDITGCMIARLRSFSELTALVGTTPPRVSAVLQDAWSMPTKAVIIRRAGGTPRADDYTLGRLRTRFDVLCFGQNGLEADRVWAMVDAILVPAQGGVGGRTASFTLTGCRVDDIVPEGGPLADVDPGSGWPRVFASYQVSWWSV